MKGLISVIQKGPINYMIQGQIKFQTRYYFLQHFYLLFFSLYPRFKNHLFRWKIENRDKKILAACGLKSKVRLAIIRNIKKVPKNFLFSFSAMLFCMKMKKIWPKTKEFPNHTYKITCALLTIKNVYSIKNLLDHHSSALCQEIVNLKQLPRRKSV